MEMNLSEESVQVIVNSLRNSRTDLQSQIKKLEEQKLSRNKLDICKHQLKEVNEVIDIFEQYGY